MSRPKALELFSGVGGMTLGFEQAGFNVIAALDIDPINTEYHHKNFPDCMAIEADVARLSSEKLRRLVGFNTHEIDVLFGGPPCQGFSLIGKRRSNDERNGMVSVFGRWVARLKPKYFVLENVPGLLLGDARHIFDAFRSQVRRAGYALVEPVEILNATDFGVPQRRRRAFILGYQKRFFTPSYPRATPLQTLKGQPYHPTVWDAIGDLPDIASLDELRTVDRYCGELSPPSYYAKLMRGMLKYPVDLGCHWQINGKGLGGCLRTIHTEATISRFRTTTPGTYEPTSRCFRLDGDAVAPTLRAGTGPANGSFTAARPIHPTSPRCITTREAARLHSFPDWFEFHPTKWHGFRQVGNAVPPLLARAIAMKIHDCLKAL